MTDEQLAALEADALRQVNDDEMPCKVVMLKPHDAPSLIARLRAALQWPKHDD